MFIGDLKKTIEKLPDDMEVAMEETSGKIPIINPRFKGEKILTLQYVKRELREMKCSYCGSVRVTETDNFCGNCGRKLKKFCDCWIKKSPLQLR